MRARRAVNLPRMHKMRRAKPKSITVNAGAAKLRRAKWTESLTTPDRATSSVTDSDRFKRALETAKCWEDALTAVGASRATRRKALVMLAYAGALRPPKKKRGRKPLSRNNRVERHGLIRSLYQIGVLILKKRGIKQPTQECAVLEGLRLMDHGKANANLKRQAHDYAKHKLAAAL